MQRNYVKQIRRLWPPPRRHGDADEDREVSFLELFYDLVYVVLIAAAAHNLAHHMDWPSLGEFIVVFGLIWIAWLNGTAQYDLHGREDIRTRVFTFAQMLLVALMAVYASDGKGGRDEFALVYATFFVILAWLWFSVYLQGDAERRRVSRIYLILILLAVSAMIGSVFAPPSAQLWIWGAVALTWVCAIFLMSRATMSLSNASSLVSDSLVERFGLFTIIVLGEVVVGVVDGISDALRNLETIATGMLALGVGFALWWNYFDLLGRRRPRAEQVVCRFGLYYTCH